MKGIVEYINEGKRVQQKDIKEITKMPPFYKDLSEEEQKKYEVAKEKCRSARTFYHKAADGSTTFDTIYAIWGVMMPSGKVSKSKYTTLSLDMMRLDNKRAIKAINDTYLERLPEGYSWFGPVLHKW